MVNKLTIKQVNALLRAKGFSPSACEQIRISMVDDAVRNADNIHSDRIYTIIALMLREAYGFGYKRIYKGMQKFDELSGKVNEGWKWEDMMKTLHEETGIVIHSGDDDRIGFEYDPEAEI